MKTIKHLVIFICIFFLAQRCLAQAFSISGKVTDENGNPVAYSSILFKTGQGYGRTGTMTDVSGNYWITLKQPFDTMLCSHVGFIESRQNISGNNKVNVVLKRSAVKQTFIAKVGSHRISQNEIDLQRERWKVKKLKDSTIVQTEEEKIFTKVEIWAQFSDGEERLQKYLLNNIVYPDSATISEVHGTVTVRFTISAEGSVSNVFLLKGVNKFADAAVMDAITKMPRWAPAIQNGRYVADEKEISVGFNIEGENVLKY